MERGGWQAGVRATRIDRGSGTREEVGYLGARGERVLAVRHLPAGEPRACVVVVPPLCTDFLRNYRREVLLARALAGRGVAVARFHYRGTGNSEGDPATTEFDDLRQDVQLVCDDLRSSIGPVPVAFVATRLGALVAAAAAVAYPGAPLALADPVSEARVFFREGFRARMAAGVRAGSSGGVTTAALVAELEELGVVDILGHTVHRALYRSASGRSLAVELAAGGPRPVQWLQFGGSGALHVGDRGVVAHLQGQGFDVCADVVGDQLAWWFVDDEDGMSYEAVPVIAAWLEHQLSTEDVPV